MTDLIGYDPVLARFREACGAVEDIRLGVTHVSRQEGGSRAFPLPYVVIGRHNEADLVLDDPRVSLRHGYLQMVDGRLWCVDLESRTGTSWEQGYGRSGWLESSRGILIGPFLIRPTASSRGVGAVVGRPQDPAATLPPERDLLPAITLEFANATKKDATWKLNRALTLVGRSSACKVRLIGSSVSKFHCSLLRTPLGLWVIDLLGAGGIAVNGKQLRWSPLNDGDRLQVGSFTIQVRFDDKPRLFRPTPLASPTAPALANSRPAQHPPALSGAPTAGEAVVESIDYAKPPDLPPLQALVLPAGSEPSSANLLPLMSQFAQMQQHMLEQFQHATLGMVQMFSDLHRDQVRVLREELIRLHQLTSELTVLRAELAKHPAPPSPQPASPPGLARVNVVRSPASKTSDVDTDEVVTAPGNVPSMPAATQEPVAASASRGGSAPSPQAATDASTRTEGQVADADIHGWLQKRFETLQQERQTSWQKIVNLLLGKQRETTPT
jgi:predicted component of type VI protein secretion system